MKPLTLEQAAQWAGGTPRGTGLITHVTIHSKTAYPGSLFVALPGTRVDGHQFVPEVLAKGAFAMVRTGAVDLPGVIEVDDPLVGLQNLARAYLAQFDVPVVAVTGSNGKTTTKDMITRILAERYAVHSSEENYNNELGLPLSVLGFNESHQALVVEMGMRGLGQIKALTKICPPSAAVITNVGPVHFELLGTMENIAQAKGEILDNLPEDGFAVLNGDDPLVRRLGHRTQAEVLLFGRGQGNDLTLSNLTTDSHGRVRFWVEGLGAAGEVSLNVPGIHNAWNAAAALAVGLKLGVPFSQCQQALKDVSLSSMRLEAVPTSSGALVINDAYNASPASMRAALDTFAAMECQGRRLAILGDMLELGRLSRDAHREVGEYAAQVCDELYFVGQWAETYRQGAGGGKAFASVEDLLNNLPRVESGDLVLVKASRGLRFERVVERLQEGD
jgi:UDP-N-acetylmuramoyl-tripeptide--D-alanyl-D-alanine ligase